MNDSTPQHELVHDDSVLSSRWLTVGLLMVVVFVLSRMVGVMDSPAYAEMAISENGYTMMTTDGGTDEVLVVIDSREEMILVYRATPGGGNQSGVELLDREALSGLFQRARTRAVGGP
ncbi:MAG: hypothetical protein JJ974_10135 [Phycisphaerales bacterium]|nr:hypothetical protein [Phycisphaerales bacterium]